MSVVKEIFTLTELLDLCQPKSVSVLLEVDKGHTFKDAQKNMLNVDKFDKILWEIEAAMSDQIPEMKPYLVYHRGIPEDHCQPIPVYAFLDPKTDWGKIRQTDLTIILRLDWKIEVVHLPENFEIKSSTLLDWAHSCPQP